MAAMGLRPSLHAAARKMADRLPVPLAMPYARSSAPGPVCCMPWSEAMHGLTPVVTGLDVEPGLPGWQVCIVDDKYRPVSGKRRLLQLATSRREPGTSRAHAGYAGDVARSHVSTVRVMAEVGKRC